MLRSLALRKWDGGWEGAPKPSWLARTYTADREDRGEEGRREGFLVAVDEGREGVRVETEAVWGGGMPTRWQSCLHVGGSICGYEPCGE